MGYDDDPILSRRFYSTNCGHLITESDNFAYKEFSEIILEIISGFTGKIAIVSVLHI